MGVLYYRIYDGARLLISIKNFEFARDFFLNAYDPSKGPYRFFVGGYMDDLRPFLPFEYPSIPKCLDRCAFSRGKRIALSAKERHSFR